MFSVYFDAFCEINLMCSCHVFTLLHCGERENLNRELKTHTAQNKGKFREQNTTASMPMSNNKPSLTVQNLKRSKALLKHLHQDSSWVCLIKKKNFLRYCLYKF
jgi:hypothetical protein